MEKQLIILKGVLEYNINLLLFGILHSCLFYAILTIGGGVYMDILEQDISKLTNISFKDLNEIHQNQIIQKYFDAPINNLTGIEHIFKGELRSSGIIGYHTEIILPNLYQQDSIASNLELDKKSPYKLELSDGKITSCFPITMSPTDIIIAVLKTYQLALKNPPINENCSNWSRSYCLPEYGFDIQVVMKQEQKIFDSYPIFPVH